jgi:hypothetical protein
MFTINLVNESNSWYHDTNTSASLLNQPTIDWGIDYTNFVNMYNGLDYFGGILYPVTTGDPGEDSQMLLHGYAAITGQDPINQTNFQTALGLNYQSSIFSNFFSGTAENKYVTDSEALAGYNWYGIFDKQSTEINNKDAITFTTAEFEEDINAILDPGGETGSSVNVYESYVDQILTLRGFYSEDITFTLNDDGCIVMDINDGCEGCTSGTSGTSGRGTNGDKGDKGEKGSDGSTAYELYLEENEGDPLNKTDWLNSLTGDKGETGQSGPKGDTGISSDGKDGNPGTSGTSGISITGPKGDPGDSSSGQNSYLLRLEYDASNHLIDGPGNRFMTGVANYLSEGAVVNSLSINTSSAVYSINVSFANQSTPPTSITVMAWDPDSENYDYHAYNTDAGQLEIVGATFTNDESGQWTPDIFTDFSSSSINIDVRQQYIKYGNAVAFPPPSRYAHAYLIFNFEAIVEE